MGAQMAKAVRDPEYAERRLQWGRDSAKRWYDKNPETAREIRGRRQRVGGRRRELIKAAFVEDVLRFRVWFLGAGRCGICDGLVDVEDMHVDHIVPLSRGGEHSYANTQAAHPACNLHKYTRV